MADCYSQRSSFPQPMPAERESPKTAYPFTCVQVYGVHVSRFAGKTAPSEMSVSKQDAGISFQCAPHNTQRLTEVALSELADLQVHPSGQPHLVTNNRGLTDLQGVGTMRRTRSVDAKTHTWRTVLH